MSRSDSDTPAGRRDCAALAALSSLCTQETPMMRDVVDHIIGIAIGGILFYGPFLLFLD